MNRWAYGFCLIFMLAACDEEADLIKDLNNNNNNNNPPKGEAIADSIRLNEIQIIGSHNSYRLKTYEPIYQVAQGASALLPSNLNPDGWDYTHPPLEVQFSEYGIRKIELDLYYDPDGGRFANRAGNQLVQEPLESNIPELNEPGFKVIHIADMDYMTNYYTFKSALQAVKDWSDANQYHLPIFILIEAKMGNPAAALPGAADVLDWDVTALDAFDQEVRDIYGNLENVLTPEKVRGNYATLNEAISTEGWPRIGDVRGKVVFLFNNSGSVLQQYIDGHPSLEGRIMFVDATPGTPEAAFIMQNNAFSSKIAEWVEQGYIVRTRSDSDTREARTGDISKREAAFNSGAQIISTDYYRPDPRHLTEPDEWTDYCVKFNDSRVARLNPINGPDKFININKIE